MRPIETDEPKKQEQITAVLDTYLETADLSVISKGLRNLLINYFQKHQDREVWFDVFLLEVTSLFDFLDEMEDIYSDSST